LFEEQAHRAPEALALLLPAGGRGNGPLSLNYGELDGRANWLANRLLSAGVGPRQMVAVLMDRSPEMIVALLAVLKSGAAYVPLDPSYPRERLDFMMTDTGAPVLITQSSLLGLVRPLERLVVVVDEEKGSLPAAAVDSGAQVSADSPAYVIYTSGSTGRPKGVVVPHRGIVRLLMGTTYARLDASRVVLQLAPVSFDAATFEVWGPLLHGGRCVLYPESGFPDLALLAQIVRETGVTTMWLTASMFNMVIDQAPDTIASVAEVLTGGEALSVAHVRRALTLLPGVQFINGYGPTESTTFACCYRIPRTLPPGLTSIPIGSPIANTTVRLLDTELRPGPPGEPGDLYIGGDGLAIGYLNRPELTAERFMIVGEERLYKTGDRARLLNDGALEFLGRLDDQVKIRGHRVELGEIEASLRAHAAVGDAVVLLREDSPGDKRLAAYYTGQTGTVEPSAAVLRQFLSERLPEYMIPSHFVPLREIPLTANGKADRRSLPAPGRRRPTLDRPALAPRTPVEAWIARHWSELLNIDEVGVHDRFFELGGNSITAVRLLGRLSHDTGSSLPALLLFRAPTVAQMAAILEQEHGNVLPASPARVGVAPRALGEAAAERAARQRDELRDRRTRRRHAS
jgi:amino acid adenylation domain-containing protein